MIAALSFAETSTQAILTLCREGCSIACRIRPLFPAWEKDRRTDPETAQPVGDFSSDLFTLCCNSLSDVLQKAVKRPRNGLATISILRGFRCHMLVKALCRHFLQSGRYRFGRVVLHIGGSSL